MTFSQLLSWIDMQNQRLIDGSTHTTSQERVYARTLKLSEEAGELSEDILALHGDQRSEKLSGDLKNNVAKECADVIITTLMIAKNLDIDITRALKQKIETINARHTNQLN